MVPSEPQGVRGWGNYVISNSYVNRFVKASLHSGDSIHEPSRGLEHLPWGRLPSRHGQDGQDGVSIASTAARIDRNYQFIYMWIGSCDYAAWEVPRSVAGNLESQESTWYKFQLLSESKSGEDQYPRLKTGRENGFSYSQLFLIYSDLYLIIWGPPTKVRTICVI